MKRRTGANQIDVTLSYRQPDIILQSYSDPKDLQVETLQDISWSPRYYEMPSDS